MPQYIMPGKQSPAFQSLDEFTQGYIEAMLWTEEDNLAAESDTLESSGVALSKTPQGIESHFIPGNIGFENIAAETLEKIIADCQKFRWKHSGLILAAATKPEYNDAQAGHDFWLTRNRHGAGRKIR